MNPEELVNLKNELDIASDKLTEKIKQFEADLMTLGLGIRAWTDITPNVNVGYDKWNNTWGVYVSYDNHGEPLTRHILECPRELRLLVYKKRLELLEAIECAAKSFLIRLNEELK